MTGLFISFEGPDGTGKSTQLRRLAARLRAEGREVIETREPGGSDGAEEIRRLVLTGEPGRWSPTAEALLFAAARRDHLDRVIGPGVDRGAVVLCDRFADSSRVYQGLARDGAEPGLVDRLHALAIGREPDATLLFDMDPEAALARAGARGGPELRFERLGLAFQRRARAAFLELAAQAPGRIRVVDAEGAEAAVAARVDEALAPLLPEVAG